jgi:dihydroorotase
MIAMMTINPARLCPLPGKGTLEVGADADVTVIDPRLAWTIDAGEFQSKGRNCPFHGWNVTGRAVATIVGGHVKLNRDPGRLRGEDDAAPATVRPAARTRR